MSGNYLGKRVLAYLIDMLVVTVFTMTFTEVKYLNPTYDEYNSSLDKVNELVNGYAKSYVTFLDYYSDNEISLEEYEDLINDNMFSNYFVDAYSDNSISEEEKDTIIDEVTKYYEDNVYTIYRDKELASWYYYTVYIVSYLAYFVLFNIITNGATLGKKIMKLRIVSSDDTNAKWYQYLFRTVILFNLWLLLIEILIPYILSDTYFIRATYILSGVYSLLQAIIILTIVFRKDNRGLHDILSKTKVVEE